MEARAQDPVKSELRNSNDEPIDGFCYGYSTEHIINDTDTTNFPQESTSHWDAKPAARAQGAVRAGA